MPDEGESLIQLAQPNEGSRIPDGAAAGAVRGRRRLRRRRPVPRRGAVRGRLRPFTEAAFGAPSGPVAWRAIPSWYLLGTEDRAIPPATQRHTAERAGATIVELPASHASMVSQPEAVTELILTAVEATAGTRTADATA